MRSDLVYESGAAPSTGSQQRSLPSLGLGVRRYALTTLVPNTPHTVLLHLDTVDTFLE
ncbi:MAG: hypothetical protein Tsb0020_15540 [Haliangiales bacterium]